MDIYTAINGAVVVRIIFKVSRTQDEFRTVCCLYNTLGLHTFSTAFTFHWFKFISWLTVCVAGDTLTGDDIQLSADVNIICADTILALVNKD